MKGSRESAQQRWAKKNRAKMRAACRRWRARHSDRQRASTYRWREQNRDAWNAYQRRWRKAHPGLVRAATRRKYLAIRRNPERYAEYLAAQRRWARKHPEYGREKSRRQRAASPRKWRAYHRGYMRRWYATHRRAARKKLRQRRAADPERWRAYDRAAYRKIRKNPKRWARKLAQSSAWVKRNPAKQRQRVENYRVRKIGAPGSHTLAEWIARVARFRWRCVYCGVRLTLRTLTKDHRIPLSKGGSNSAWNLLPACKSCNSAKADRLQSQSKKGRKRPPLR